MKCLVLPVPNKEKGMATIESVALIFAFLIMISFSLGMFGIVHSGILNSIGARNYTFETLRNRANVGYFRSNCDLKGCQPISFTSSGNRIHRVISESLQSGGRDLPATERPISIGFNLNNGRYINRNREDFHNEVIFEDQNLFISRRYEGAGVNPVWLQTQYGICLNSSCGGSQ